MDFEEAADFALESDENFTWSGPVDVVERSARDSRQEESEFMPDSKLTA